jgi:hypothetical protein
MEKRYWSLMLVVVLIIPFTAAHGFENTQVVESGTRKIEFGVSEQQVVQGQRNSSYHELYLSGIWNI